MRDAVPAFDSWGAIRLESHFADSRGKLTMMRVLCVCRVNISLSTRLAFVIFHHKQTRFNQIFSGESFDGSGDLRHRIDRAGGDGPEPGFEYERSRIQSGGLQPDG